MWGIEGAARNIRGLLRVIRFHRYIPHTIDSKRSSPHTTRPFPFEKPYDGLRGVVSDPEVPYEAALLGGIFACTWHGGELVV